MTDYPKVLIIGQPFNMVSGGGITISNLFSRFPAPNLFLATNTHRAMKNDFSICPNVYLLGDKEVKIPTVFKYFLKNEKSGIYRNGIIPFNSQASPSIVPKTKIGLYKILSSIISFFDISYILFRIKLSNEFIGWLSEIKPDVIYTQLGHIEFIMFVKELKKNVNIPLVVHIMDDWPEMSAHGIFRCYWQHKLKVLFVDLLKNVDLLIGISESMATEYEKRYCKRCQYFHNPITISHYKREQNNRINNTMDICYLGRIGGSNIKNIKKMARVIERLNRYEQYKINFIIYSPDHFLLDELNNLTYTKIRSNVLHNQVPEVFSKNDILYLPIDFDKISRKYAKFSFPTKASEYMASGKIIFVHAPADIAITQHAKDNKWAIVVDKDDSEEVARVLKDLYVKRSDYLKFAENAKEIAFKEFDMNSISVRFCNILVETIKSYTMKN